MSDRIDPWIPIETAPKDGTSVLLCFGKYTAEPDYSFKPVVGFWGNYHPNSRGKDCWRCSRTRDRLADPVAWMELPYGLDGGE